MRNWNPIVKIPILIMGLLMFIAYCSSKKPIYDGKPETGSFTDPRDGKIYKTVKVGDQWIMAENLAYKPDKGNFWAYDNIDSNIAIYGYLYDWETAMNIAPDGWHLPSRKEWKAVEKELGLKLHTFHYLEKIYPKLIVGGSSGLDMLLSGERTCNGVYKNLGNNARFWLSDKMYESRSEKAVYGLDCCDPHGLRESTVPHVFDNAFQKTCPGYSVLLFKD